MRKGTYVYVQTVWYSVGSTQVGEEGRGWNRPEGTRDSCSNTWVRTGVRDDSVQSEELRVRTSGLAQVLQDNYGQFVGPVVHNSPQQENGRRLDRLGLEEVMR